MHRIRPGAPLLSFLLIIASSSRKVYYFSYYVQSIIRMVMGGFKNLSLYNVVVIELRVVAVGGGGQRQMGLHQPPLLLLKVSIHTMCTICTLRMMILMLYNRVTVTL